MEKRSQCHHFRRPLKRLYNKFFQKTSPCKPLAGGLGLGPTGGLGPGPTGGLGPGLTGGLGPGLTGGLPGARAGLSERL